MELSLRERLPRIGIFAAAVREEGALESILALLQPKSFPAGTVIFGEGDEGHELYILHRGRVRINKKTPHGDNYTVVLLDEGQDAFFGEAGLLDLETRSASVIAETAVECFVMNRDAFTRLGDEHPKIGIRITREIAKILSQRLRKANQDLVTLLTALISEIEGELGGSSRRTSP